MFRKVGIIVLIMAALVLLALPLVTQADAPDPSTLTMVSGPVDLSQGAITIEFNGSTYIIAPNGAFSPSILQQGDDVIITGYLLPDGVTIQATSFEFFNPDQQQLDATPEPTAEVTGTPEPTAEVTGTPEPTLEAASQLAAATTEASDTGACTNPNQPVAQRLADAFNTATNPVTYQDIMNWRCDGFGFGEIARAYLLADADPTHGPDYYFGEKTSGMGWGQIVKEAGVKPSELAPGHVIHNGQNDNSPFGAQTNGNGHGNNGHGNNGHGNNGHGNNGHGNGKGQN